MRESIFDEVKIKWGDKEYIIPANRVMALIQRIEEHISFTDLSGRQPKVGKIAGAWAEVLRYAGAPVTDEEVYADMFHQATSGQVTTAISGLLLIMIPPEALQKKTEAEPKEASQPPAAETQTSES